MTSRERVRKAMSFEEPDRVPIGLGGNKDAKIHMDAYIELGKYLGLDLGMPKVVDQFMMTVQFDERISRRLYSDIVELNNPSERFGLENRDWKPWKNGLGNYVLMPGNYNPVVDENGYTCIYNAEGTLLAHMPPHGLYFEYPSSTQMSDQVVKMDPMEWKKSIPLYSEEHLRILENEARRLFENTEYSLHGGFNKGSLGSFSTLAGHTLSDWLCMLLTEEDYAYSILQATADRIIENLTLYLQAVGRYIDSIFVSSYDFGTQNGELFNPEIFRKLYVPHYRRINDYVHGHSKAKVVFHSCGSIYEIIEHFIHAGVDVLNPVQTSAKNMEPERLMARYGGRIAFWGGAVDTQDVLPFGTTEQVIAQVRERMKIFAPGGGFIFNPIHNIQYGVPPENIIAMVDAAVDAGKYPIARVESSASSMRRGDRP
jgi:uroporphyrinogen decarboxylase